LGSSVKDATRAPAGTDGSKVRSLRIITKHREEMRRFGRRFWLRNLRGITKEGLRPIHLNGMEPIYIRPGESDLEVVHEVFFARHYDIRSEAVRDRVARRYAEIVGAGKLPIIIDAGANIGASTIWFARQYPQARIAAVEPDPGNLGMLRRNIRPYGNCSIIDAAIGAEPGFVSLSNSGEQLAWSVQTTRSSAGVPVVTLDDAFKSSGGDEPFIVKIDIEGFERDLFASNLAWLDRTYVVFVEPHDWMFPGERPSGPLQRAMANHSFELFIAGDNLVYVRT
jgi:FkbM family methyltransferase